MKATMVLTALAAVVSASALVSQAASAAGNAWELIAAQDRQAMFLQPVTLVRAGSVARVTVLEDFVQRQFLGEPVYPHRSRQVTYRVDCGSSEVGYEAWTLYEDNLGQGSIVWSGTAETASMFRASAEPLTQSLLDRVCGPVALAAH